MPLLQSEVGGLSVSLLCNGATALLVFEDDDNSVTFELALAAAELAGTDWFLLKIVRDGTDLIVTIGKTEMTAETVTVVAYSGDATLMDDFIGKIAFPRLLDKAVSLNASNYYIDDIEQNDGDSMEPRY